MASWLTRARQQTKQLFERTADRETPLSSVPPRSRQACSWIAPESWRRRPSETLCKQRRGKVGRSWYCDETYLKVKGLWVYLYRAINRDGNLVAVLLSERQDQAAAEAFFRSA